MCAFVVILRCEKPIPCGIKISWSLEKQKSEFYLMRTQAEGDPRDTEKYEAIILRCYLYVKIARMTEPLFDSLKLRFKTEDIKYHYRKVTCNQIAIPIGNQYLVTRDLFPDS